MFPLSHPFEQLFRYILRHACGDVKLRMNINCVYN